VAAAPALQLFRTRRSAEIGASRAGTRRAPSSEVQGGRAWLTLAALTSACFAGDAHEIGRSRIGTASPAQPSAAGVDEWGLYEEPGGLAVVGESAEGSFEVELLELPDGARLLTVGTPAESGALLVGADGTLLESTLWPSPATLLALGELEQASRGVEQPCPGCAAAVQGATAIGWGAVGVCVGAGVLTVLAISNLGVNPVFTAGAFAGRIGCLAMLSAYGAAKMAQHVAIEQGAANAASRGEPPLVVGRWRDQPQPQALRSGHPYAPSQSASASALCPAEATHIRIRFGWIELAPLDAVAVSRPPSGPDDQPVPDLLLRKGRATSLPLRGIQARIDLLAQPPGAVGNRWGFEVEAVECFFPDPW